MLTNDLKHTSIKICQSKIFDIVITAIIIINSVLIGVQTSLHNTIVDNIQHFILWVFSFEIVIRFIAANSIRDFLKDGWNIFDLSLVIIGWIPPSIATNASAITMIRIMRTFRILRLLRASMEIKLIVTVLAKSVKSMIYNCLLFLIFAYLYAVAGVTLFRLPVSAEKIEILTAVAPPTPTNSPDPFGNIGEGIFTLFRALTAEDWTDLRYNLITASDLGIINVHPTAITCYFVSWFCIAVFLLLNLVTGAVINNYQVAMAELSEQKDKLKSS
ncbi:MAG: ion transporter [Barnesiella sp.]|nr:ion transporter [Barnesiella sp.]